MIGIADKTRPKAVSVWLFIVAALVVVMILVGGLTRLTDSGLSITEWKPVTGAVPPLSDEAWASEFAKYQEIPEYQQQNHGMTVEEFKHIYWWEWGHRFLGRFIGVAFLVPLIFFSVRGAIPRGFGARLTLLFLLGGVQGGLGWWMVASGLSERVDVSQYRLAAHLGVAFVLLGALWWTALDVRGSDRRRRRWRAESATYGAFALLALVAVQIVLGAFVAGLDAGRVYTDWPLMGGRLVPETYGALSPFWVNAFENPAAVQLHHRLVGYALTFAALFTAIKFSASTNIALARQGFVVAGAALLQAALGIFTLMSAAPIDLSIAHQLGAVALFLAVISLVRSSVRR